MSGPDRDGRNPAEWVTFVVALVLVMVVAGLIAAEVPGSKRPPSPVAAVGAVVERDGRFVVPVRVENRGERTARSVQVVATVTIDDAEHQADQTVDFLAGRASTELEFVFDEDPEDGRLDVRVSGYALP